MKKRPMLTFFVLFLLFVVSAEVYAESAPAFYISEGGEGIVYRSKIARSSVQSGLPTILMPRALTEELDVAYLECSDTYLTVGAESTWTIHATGGDGIYKYRFFLYYKDFSNTSRADGAADYALIEDRGRSSESSCTFSINKAGRYIIIVRIYNGSNTADYTDWQSRVFETASTLDYSKTTTVAGKVKKLAADCKKAVGSDPYRQVVWVHDWLLANASYDTTYTYYSADGVLLNGKGVCNSYALAFDLLMQELDIESRYVIGYKGTVAHAWNIVKLDGQWYHIDCTTDDGSNKQEHRYCLVPDLAMRRDYTWSKTAYLPACSNMDMNYHVKKGAKIADSIDDVRNYVVDAVNAQKTQLILVTENSGFDLEEAIRTVLEEQKELFYGQVTTMAETWLACICFSYNGTYPSLPRVSSINVRCDDRYLTPGNVTQARGTYMPQMVLMPGLNEMVPVQPVWSIMDTDIAVIDSEGGVTAIGSGSTEVLYSYGTVVGRYSVFAEDYEMVLPAGLSGIEDGAFEDCDDIRSVRIPEGSCSEIGNRAFADCDSLKIIRIPANVIRIAEGAFTGSEPMIVCESGSEAHAYAMLHGLEYYCRCSLKK